MPQFDPSTFGPQLFWLLVTFVTLYLLMSRLVLPRITDVARSTLMRRAACNRR